MFDLFAQLFSTVNNTSRRLDVNEPSKYKRKRKKFIGVLLFICLIAFLTFQFHIFRCAKEVGDYDVCRYKGGDIDAASRMLAERSDVQYKDNGTK